MGRTGCGWRKRASGPTSPGELFALAYLYAIFLQLLSKDGRKVFLTGAVLIVLVCTFGPMMHERYVYPAVILLLLAYADCRDRRLLWSALALTVTLFMNEALVLQGGMTELNYGHLDSSENWLNVSLSVVNVINALFLAWTALDVCRPAGRIYPLPCPRKRPAAQPEKGYKMGLRRLDVLLMAAVTAVYAVAAFVNLGDTQSPADGVGVHDAGRGGHFRPRAGAHVHLHLLRRHQFHQL